MYLQEKIQFFKMFFSSFIPEIGVMKEDVITDGRPESYGSQHRYLFLELWHQRK